MDKLNDLLKEYSQDISVEDLDSLKVLRGFIEWLVQNDKIDLLKLTCMNPRYTEILDSDFSWKERIIMILSIEENPINFLIQCLK